MFTFDGTLPGYGTAMWFSPSVFGPGEATGHVGEEEQEQFVAAEAHLGATDVRYMRRVFNRRKKEEKAAARVEPKIKLKP